MQLYWLSYGSSVRYVQCVLCLLDGNINDLELDRFDSFKNDGDDVCLEPDPWVQAHGASCGGIMLPFSSLSARQFHIVSTP